MNIKINCALNSISVCVVITVAKLCGVAAAISNYSFENK
jgi:hypothetical protein